MLKYKMLIHDKIKFSDGTTLYRIKACKDFETETGRIIHKGEKGGYIEKVSNLTQAGNCWVADNALVFDSAEISGNAFVYNEACVCGEAKVYGNAIVCNKAFIYVYNGASVYGENCFCNNEQISGYTNIFELEVNQKDEPDICD